MSVVAWGDDGVLILRFHWRQIFWETSPSSHPEMPSERRVQASGVTWVRGNRPFRRCSSCIMSSFQTHRSQAENPRDISAMGLWWEVSVPQVHGRLQKANAPIFMWRQSSQLRIEDGQSFLCGGQRWEHLGFRLSVKAMIFPVVMYRCENWTLEKAESWRIDAFKLWRRLLRVPWAGRRPNQSILKETNPEYSFEGWMLKLKLQYCGYLMWTADSFKRPWCWERLKAGRDGGDRGWDG